MEDKEEKIPFVINKYSRKRGISGSITEEESLIVSGEDFKEVKKTFDERWESK